MHLGFSRGYHLVSLEYFRTFEEILPCSLALVTLRLRSIGHVP